MQWQNSGPTILITFKPLHPMQNDKHVHQWRTFNRKGNAIPLWTDCIINLTTNVSYE